MDLTFGDYLRAIITADLDHVSIDDKGYRIAFVEAFRRRGISVTGIPSMAVEDLVFERNPLGQDNPAAEAISTFLRKFAADVAWCKTRQQIFETTQQYIDGLPDNQQSRNGKQTTGLHELIQQIVKGQLSRRFQKVTGLLFPDDKPTALRLGVEWGYLSDQMASYAVGNIHLARRSTPDGRILNHVVVTLAQKRGVHFKSKTDRYGKTHYVIDERGWFVPQDDETTEGSSRESLTFRGGCTLIFDLDQQTLLYAISKPITDKRRMQRQFDYQTGSMGSAPAMYFGTSDMQQAVGPFAMMHSHIPGEGNCHDC